jgi:hypothetical protein
LIGEFPQVKETVGDECLDVRHGVKRMTEVAPVVDQWIRNTTGEKDDNMTRIESRDLRLFSRPKLKGTFSLAATRSSFLIVSTGHLDRLIGECG